MEIHKGFKSKFLEQVAKSYCALRCWEQWYKALLLPFLENARVSYSGVGAVGASPVLLLLLGPSHQPTLTIPCTHLPSKSTPALMHPSVRYKKINPNRGSPYFPQKHFLPHLLNEEL